MSFEDIQNGHQSYQNRNLLEIRNVAPMPPPSFGWIEHAIWEGMPFENFQNGCHTGYCKEMSLTILTLRVAPIPPNKFQLNLTYGSRDVFLKNL